MVYSVDTSLAQTPAKQPERREDWDLAYGVSIVILICENLLTTYFKNY